MDVTVVVTALIGGIVAMVQAYLVYANKRRAIKVSKDAEKALAEANTELSKLKVELKLQSDAFDFKVILQHMGEVNHALSTLMKETNVDRFLMFHAWNGKHDPKYTTAVYQYRQGEQEPVSYIRFEFDEDYRERLSSICRHKRLYFNVGDIDPCDIKDIYQAEGVESSLWVHVLSHTDAGTGGTSINYCSFASHTDEPLSNTTQMKCVLVANMLTRMYESSLNSKDKIMGLVQPDNQMKGL